MKLDTGIVGIYTLENTAEKGDMPKEQLVEHFYAYYGERTISYNRQYQAKGVQEQVDLLIRIWDEGYNVRIGMYAIIDCEQYRITNVARALDDDTQLKIFDLTLERLDNLYDIDC